MTVTPYSFSTWRRRLDVKLELLGYNLPATPHLTPGTRNCPLKSPDQLPGKHPPSLPAPRLTPFSLKSHCSAGCWVVLGHMVSFTLKLTGFRAPGSSTWSRIKVGRLGSAHVSFSDLSPCPQPDDSLSSPLCVRPWAWCREHRGGDRARARPHGHTESRSGPHSSADGSASPQRG